MSLDRFLKAQENEYSGYDTALKEIKSGQKRSHWMWYIFPQLKGLGYSEMAQYYGIANLEEAQEYVQHPVLGGRLLEITEALLQLEENNARMIMGAPDDVKLRSSMTLFYLASQNPIFEQAIDKFFDGKMDKGTMKILKLFWGCN